MTALNLKPTHKAVQDYYTALEEFDQIDVTHEGAVSTAFLPLLQHCGRQFDWILVPEYMVHLPQNKRIIIDGAFEDAYKRPHGYWEAKDEDDDLPSEVQRKFEEGYPYNNILFQTPQRAILWQNGHEVRDADLTDPTQLIEVLDTFFSYHTAEDDEWERAVVQFREEVPELGKGLAEHIRDARLNAPPFTHAFAEFHELCRQSINPNLSKAAVEEMLIQHLFTERIFHKVFDDQDFVRRNIIAREIEKVIKVLTEHAFNRNEYLESLAPFYTAMERAAGTIYDYYHKQEFLNTVYKTFFQGYSVKLADTHGIVYTPQTIADFMVRSVEEILKTQFNRSLSDSGVHIIDPFVGTGNFIMRTMREIEPTALEHKYENELHCNEVLLLPYYIASMNIERYFYEATGRYQPFEGICFVDTFDQPHTRQLDFLRENTERVAKQKQTPMFVVSGNPPYNAKQVNENDNNKNRPYPIMDEQVRKTYTKDSTASNKQALSDPYVKAIRWASDRIETEGVVAFITNRKFIVGEAYDGMRKHLAADFDTIYILDLGGDARSGSNVSDANVFGITVGVSINFFIKSPDTPNPQAEIFYARVDESWHKEKIFEHLISKQNYLNIEWKRLMPDNRHTWLTDGLHAEFETFIPTGSKQARRAKGEGVGVIFKTYSNGVKTNRDWWAYNFNRNALAENMSRMIDTYNAEVYRWQRRGNQKADVDDFVDNDETKIKWSRDLKSDLERGKIAEYTDDKVRTSLYRPFTESNLFLDRVMNEEVYVFPSIFPTLESETENRIICVSGVGHDTFRCHITDRIADLKFSNSSNGGTQCFPFYTYDADGRNRRENITDWALKDFRAHYRADRITKWDIFHYVYALLHHPDYRERYEADLKRDLPHLPYAPNFLEFVKAGQELGEIHVGYDDVEEYSLRFVKKPNTPIDWRVEKMKLSKDKTQIVYNTTLTLDGIPPAVFGYKLGNRSALEWVINQYQVKTDERKVNGEVRGSGIVNDPNRADDERYIVRLIGKVITVSLETVRIVERIRAGLSLGEIEK